MPSQPYITKKSALKDIKNRLVHNPIQESNNMWKSNYTWRKALTKASTC